MSDDVSNVFMQSICITGDDIQSAFGIYSAGWLLNLRIQVHHFSTSVFAYYLDSIIALIGDKQSPIDIHLTECLKINVKCIC